MKKLGLATALLLAMTGAQAYQFEVQGQSEYVDTIQNDKNFTGGVQGTYYLKDVDSSKGPLAEAAFLNQASNVSLAYNYAKYNEKLKADKSNNGINADIHTYGVKGEAFIPTPFVPVYTSASYSHTELAGQNRRTGDDSGDRYALEVGAMVLPNFLVAVGYTSVPNQFSLDTFGILNNGIGDAALESVSAIRNKTDAATARAKYVGEITDTNMSIGFEAAATFGDNAIYGLNTDLFLNPALSVGLTFIGTDGNARFDETRLGRFDQAWGVNVNYFVTPAISVGASYLHADQKANAKIQPTTGHAVKAYDTETVGLNAKFRF